MQVVLKEEQQEEVVQMDIVQELYHKEAIKIMELNGKEMMK